MTDNPTKYFSRRAVVNFDIIHHECRGDPLKRSYKEHQTATNEDFEKFPEHDKKKKRLGRVFRNNKENDLWVKRDLMLEYFDKNF